MSRQKPFQSTHNYDGLRYLFEISWMSRVQLRCSSIVRSSYILSFFQLALNLLPALWLKNAHCANDNEKASILFSLR